MIDTENYYLKNFEHDDVIKNTNSFLFIPSIIAVIVIT